MEPDRPNPPVREAPVSPRRYVTCGCLDAERRQEADADRTIEKLRRLVSDPVTSDQVDRISRLLRDYLREIGDDGSYVSFRLSMYWKV